MSAPTFNGAKESLLTPGQVAALFHVDPKTVTRWAHAGRLGSLRTPGRAPPLPRDGGPGLAALAHHRSHPLTTISDATTPVALDIPAFRTNPAESPTGGRRGGHLTVSPLVATHRLGGRVPHGPVRADGGARPRQGGASCSICWHSSVR